MSTVSWPALALAAILGLAVGSFINVLAYRVPRKESIVYPASHCVHCQTPIKARHNLPVIGWMLIGGRCTNCGDAVSSRYPLVEAGTALLFMGVTLRFGVSIQLPAYLFLVAAGMTMALIDLDVRRLPDSIVLPAYLVTVLLLMPAGAVDADWRQAERAGLGMLAMQAIYFALVLADPDNTTAGDVKLAGLLGLYLGWLSWSSLLVGAVGGLLIGGLSGRTLSAIRSRHSVVLVALGPCMLTAASVALFFTIPLASGYRALLGAT